MDEKEMLELLLSKMDNMENNMNSKFDTLQGQIGNLQGRIDTLQGQFGNLQGQVDVIANEVIIAKTTLENETNRNMRVIAEGHENLNYKLDKAVQYSNKMEIIEIRINRLENEIEKLKKLA